MEKLAAVLMIALLTSCSAEDRRDALPTQAREKSSAPAPAQTAGAALDLTSRCTNDAGGYSIAYPAGWNVNRGDVVAPCTLFDPEPIEVPPYSEIPHDIAVQVGIDPVPFATLAGEVMGRRTISREETTVAGRNAVRVFTPRSEKKKPVPAA